MTNLPQEGLSQEIGRLAARALSNKLPRSWIDKQIDGDSDFGIDYMIQLKSNDNYVSASFYMQLKGTTCPSYSSDRKYISYSFKVRTLNYYHQQEPLVMLVVVDLHENEDRLSECPVYYFWLDDDWFYENKSKLDSQDSISVKIPTDQLLDPSLDILDFYSARINERLAFNNLKKGIEISNNPVLKSIENLTKVIGDKPLILKAIEEKNDVPWIHNPEGTIANDLKKCSESMSANKLKIARRILNDLADKEKLFTENELAEFHYQTAVFFMLQGDYKNAEFNFEMAYTADSKDRYHLGYLASKLRSENGEKNIQELEEIVSALSDDSYQKCFIKAKALTLLNHEEDAIELLKKYYPDEISGQMVIYTMKDMGSELDEIISKRSSYCFADRKNAFVFNAMAARRFFNKAVQDDLFSEDFLPFQGRSQYDLKAMKDAFFFIQESWVISRELGYPSDVVVLMDVSPLIYGYFDKLDDLKEYIEEILSERPNHPEFIRPYCRMLFDTREYQRVVELLERLEVLGSDEKGLLILSYYNMGKKRKVLELVQEYEESLLSDPSQNIEIIFCFAAEIANELFDKDLAEKYENQVKKFPNGEIIILIRNFVNSCNAEPKKQNDFLQDLYLDYLKLNKPLLIAEQLSIHLDVCEFSSAERFIELSEQILKNRELTNSCYNRLAQAFFTTKNWIKAAELAEKNIAKGVEITRWKLMYAASLQQQGKVGTALKIIKEVMSNEDLPKEQQDFYITLCLSLGLLEDVVEIIQELIVNTAIKSEKLNLLKILISIYSDNANYGDELNRVISRYGELVDQDDCEQEGTYLIYFFTCQSQDKSEEQIKDFQSRLHRYTKNFPNSPMLKMGCVGEKTDAESMLESIRELTGITQEQIEKWEENKMSIRNGTLFVPFSMRGRFLSDTRDIFTTWILSLNTPEEFLEYKIKHAPQLSESQFYNLFKESKEILLEETTLLILNELDLLDGFLDLVPRFSLVKSVFENIATSSHPLGGVPYSLIPKKILKTIQKHLDKIHLIDVNEGLSIDVYEQAIKNNEVLFFTEDQCLAAYLSLEVEGFVSCNVFNALEALRDHNFFNEIQFSQHVSRVFDFGIDVPNMRLDSLLLVFKYYLDVVDGVDYADTGFKKIFDRIFSVRVDSYFCLGLFFRMLNQVNSVMDIHSLTLLSLFRGFLIRHPIINVELLIANWLIFSSIQKPLAHDFLVGRSEDHHKLWGKYKDLIVGCSMRDWSFEEMARNVIFQIFKLDERLHDKVYKSIRSSFTPITQEAEIFDRIYQQFYIENKFN